MRPVARATWRRLTWLMVRHQGQWVRYFKGSGVGSCFLSRLYRNQRERLLDSSPRGQPQQDLRVPGAVLALQGPAHVTRLAPTTSCQRFRHRCKNVSNLFCFCRNLKDGYFNEDAKYNLCYCESCYKLRGDEAYYKRGEPPRDYALPFGWCRFALR